METKLTGKIKSLPEGKNFGFIEFDRKDYFFHRENFSGFWVDLIHDFRNGDTIPVEFDEVKSDKGPRAINVKRLDFPN